MNEFEELVYPDLRMPKTGDVVYIKFKGQPDQEERLGQKLSSGGEGNIFSTQHYYSMVIKIYHPKNLTKGRVEKITALAEEIYDVNSEIFDYICWPKAIVHDYKDGHVIGYLMEKVPDDAIPLADIISQMSVNENPMNYERRDLAELCQRIAERFSLLHRLAQKRLLMCDVNPSNILISPNNKQVYFVDLDSYQYDSKNGKRLRCPVGRREYTSPELYERMRQQNVTSYIEVDRTEVDEGFAIAVLYFQILLLGREPFDHFGESYEEVIRQGKFTFRPGHLPCYIWNNLTPQLKKMFQDIFMNRWIFNDNDWINAFVMLQESIENNKYSNELRPHAYPISEGDQIVSLSCKRCNKTFMGSLQMYEMYYPFCSQCLPLVNQEEKSCKRVTCSKCGQSFVINDADLNEQANRQTVCPDCSPDSYTMRKQLFEDPKTIAKDLATIAMNNLKE